MGMLVKVFEMVVVLALRLTMVCAALWSVEVMEVVTEEVLVGSVDIKAWQKSERVFNTSRSTAEDVPSSFVSKLRSFSCVQNAASLLWTSQR